MNYDSETTFLYFADSLPKKFPEFYSSLEELLLDHKIQYSLLPGTKDIWARDYMPIQIERNRFVQFTYQPDYLIKYKKWIITISDVDPICNAIEIKPVKSRIKLDGGNVIRSKTKAILTDKIFSENPSIAEKDLLNELKSTLEVNELILIPTPPHDITGHADGVVRFLDEKTVLINDYSKEDKIYAGRLHSILQNAKLDYDEIPYNPYENKTYISARGIYINYIQMNDFIFIPTFGLPEDDKALKLFEKLFSDQSIIPIDSNDIAEEGGILNCISWNILR